MVETLKAKAERLNTPALFEQSTTLIRALAKDGLMEDGKEKLLECMSTCSPRVRAAYKTIILSGAAQGSL